MWSNRARWIGATGLILCTRTILSRRVCRFHSISAALITSSCSTVWVRTCSSASVRSACRINGIDTAEIRSSSEKENALALKAEKRLEDVVVEKAVAPAEAAEAAESAAGAAAAAEAAANAALEVKKRKAARLADMSGSDPESEGDTGKCENGGGVDDCRKRQRSDATSSSSWIREDTAPSDSVEAYEAFQLAKEVAKDAIAQLNAERAELAKKNEVAAKKKERQKLPEAMIASSYDEEEDMSNGGDDDGEGDAEGADESSNAGAIPVRSPAGTPATGSGASGEEDADEREETEPACEEGEQKKETSNDVEEEQKEEEDETEPNGEEGEQKEETNNDDQEEQEEEEHETEHKTRAQMVECLLEKLATAQKAFPQCWLFLQTRGWEYFKALRGMDDGVGVDMG
eukprot:jgi/Undpi1/5564/HiC_scaffold_2.g00841.m1